ncbi:MAG: hypothetical protein WDO19_24025 [Bacteroidota bacterium]
MRTAILIVVITMFIYACDNHKNKIRSSKPKASISQRVLKKEIPLTPRGDTIFFYKAIQHDAKLLGYDISDTEDDSIKIRIWYNYSFSSIQRVFTLRKNQENEWSAEVCFYKLKLNDTLDNETLVDKEVKILTPRNGWNYFTGKILELKITSLPDMLSLGLRAAPEGATFGFEV